jgi:hypothetical protein
MKLALLLSLFLVGCSTTEVPVTIDNPYNFPASLLEDCKEPEFINPEAKLSDNIKTMIANNTKSTECRITKRALTEMIQQREMLFDKASK